jgi:hypothetical protein
VESYTVIPEVAAAYEQLPHELRHVGYSRGSLQIHGGSA